MPAACTAAIDVTQPALDQPARLTFATYSDDARTVPADATAVSVQILDPANVETTYTLAGAQIIRDGVGLYHFDYTPAAAGNYSTHWKATGTVITACDQTFDVPAKYGLLVSTADFATYLNNPGLDTARAAVILRRAQQLCESVVRPLPNGASAVILDVAERAFTNPTATRDEGLGLYSEGVGPFNTSAPGYAGGGLFLTKGNKATLRRLNGAGGAFTIDLLPANLPTLPPWDSGNDIAILDLP